MLKEIAQQFAGCVNDIEIKPLGNGLINDTYLVSTETTSFILQRINRRVFPEPRAIMENLRVLNRHLGSKKQGTVKLCIPELLSTQNKDILFRDDRGEYWRALAYIGHTRSIEAIGGLNEARQAGFALGHFHALISDLDPLLMKDTLPGFHNTPGYMRRYRSAAATAESMPDSPDKRYCAGFIESYCHMADDLESAHRAGLLRMRINHGDPKLNNFLFDIDSNRIVGIIDLDTVKPGLLHYDIGDCLRSCCFRSETPDFDLAVCSALLESYLAEVKGFFSEQDYRYLYPAIRLIPFELGLRFFTDYLEGNRYFKVTGPLQNLDRAVQQFRLCADIIAKEAEIKALIDRLKHQSDA
ncbi:MAG: phosphotransferase enzyme family protein [Gammaproteobacteria bacterium]